MNIPMQDPIAYFLTWPTYGTWLPGDSRGWVEFRHGWKLPDPIRFLEAQSRMTEDACSLSPRDRAIVEAQVAETCEHRGWLLHAVNCRSNHMHVVVSAPGKTARKVRIDIKAWCTRRLKERSDPNRQRWFAERGSQRHIFDEDSLASAIQYVTERQAPQYHS